MKLRRRLWILYMLLAVLLCPVFAAEGVLAEDEVLTLTLIAKSDETVLPNVTFKLYYAARISESGEYILTGDFSKYNVELNDLSSSEWGAAAQTLYGYARRDALAPLEQGTTDEDGKVVFSTTSSQELVCGVYLLVAEQYSDADYRYEFQPVLIKLTESEELVYAKAKIDKSEILDLTIYKDWSDSGHESGRPSEVTIDLLKDGVVDKTVTLSEENNWTYTWDDLSQEYEWLAVEREIDGYSVRTEKIVPEDADASDEESGVLFKFTNAYEVTGTTTASSTSTSTSTTTTASSTDASTATTATDSDGKLPQTGVPWWIIIPLVGIGVFFSVLSCYSSYRAARQSKEYRYKKKKIR